ncbi:TPA: DNA-directed RNA polymerase subunit omega, partial [Enterococcus faecium]|nr:DNA-directed RNA polymerase subunit omega [Enterococcus faecium]
QQINQLSNEKNTIKNQLQSTEQKLEKAQSENSNLNNYIEKLEKAKSDVEDTANRSQEIVTEHTGK